MNQILGKFLQPFKGNGMRMVEIHFQHLGKSFSFFLLSSSSTDSSSPLLLELFEFLLLLLLGFSRVNDSFPKEFQPPFIISKLKV